MRRSSALLDRVWRLRSAVRDYIEEGRLRDLMPFLGVSFGIVLAQWLLLQEWQSGHLSEGLALLMSWLLAILWIAAVVVGIWRSGWPGVVMLLAMKWGAYPLYLTAAMVVGCALSGVCV